MREQFFVYFMYFLVLSALYVLGAVMDGLRHFRHRHGQPVPTVTQELRSPEEQSAQALCVEELRTPERTAQALCLQDTALGDLQGSAPPLLPGDRGEDGMQAPGPEAKA